MSEPGTALPGTAGGLWQHLGDWLHARGRQQLALQCYRQGARAGGMRAAMAARQLGWRLLEQGRIDDALAAWQDAQRHAQLDAPTLGQMARCSLQSGQFEPAQHWARQALSADSLQAQAWLALVESLLDGDPDQGQLEQALAQGLAAVQARPDDAPLWAALGTVHLHRCDARQATQAFARALQIDPGHLAARHHLAVLAGSPAAAQAAVDHFTQALATEGDRTALWASLAWAQQTLGDVQAAQASCDTVLARQPRHLLALFTLATCRSAQADPAGAVALLDQVITLAPTLQTACSNRAFLATYLPQASAAQVMAWHRAWNQQFGQPDQPCTRPALPLEPQARLKVGYVSGDLGPHPVGYLMQQVLAHHDANEVEVHVFSLNRQPSDMSDALRRLVPHWHEVLSVPPDELAQRIADMGLHILVDLSGHTSYHRLQTFVHKPAPVQVSWVGYFHSTGLDAIDYFITDPHTSPAHGGQLFSETPVCLPHSRFCYAPPQYAPAVASRPGDAPVVFGSFQRTDKLVQPVLQAWAAILQAVPGSRLLIKAGGLQVPDQAQALMDRLAQAGIDTARVTLRGPSGHADMLAEWGDVDIALDTFPFNGGITTLEALWMGVPVVTLAGHSVVARQSTALLANLGLADELAAPDEAGYILAAVSLAQRAERRQALRQQLRPLLAASPVCQGEAFTRDLERLYRRMWVAHCAGQRLPAWTQA